MNREQFMNFFRSDDFNNYLSDDDCIEIFLTILKGSSDITPKLITELCKDYMVDYIELAKNILTNAGYATSSLWTTTDVVLALDEMLEEGEITKEEHSKLSESALEIMNETIDGDDIIISIHDELRLFWIPEFLKKLRASQDKSEEN